MFYGIFPEICPPFSRSNFFFKHEITRLFSSKNKSKEKITGAAKIKFSSRRKSVFLKASSGESRAPRNFWLLVTLGGIRGLLCVYLAVYQMKQIHLQLYPQDPHFWHGDIENIDVPQLS